MGAIEAWRALDEPWRVSLQEAWESWCTGSAGVGSVIVDDRGVIVARGRNRRQDPRVHESSLWGARIAHAEMCAIAALPPGSSERYTIYTTFEPCLMCAAAIMLCHIPRVRYAAPDPLFHGMHDWFRDLPYTAARLPERECLGGPIGVFAHVLHVSWLAFWMGGSPSLAPHRERAARQFELAVDIVASDRLGGVVAAGGSVSDAIAALWPELEMLASLDQRGDGGVT